MKSLVLGSEDRHYGPVVLLQVQDKLLLSVVKHMDSLKALKDPSRRRSLGRIFLLIGVGAASLFQALPDAPLQSRVDQKTERLGHQQGHNPPLTLCRKEGRHKLRVLQKAEAVFRFTLPFTAL